MISKKDKLIFIHIPKTGGQTILKHFLEKYEYSWENRKHLYANYKNVGNYQINLAHLTYREYFELGIIDKNEMDNYKMFTIVRNPTDRMLSHFNMLRNKPKFLNLSVEQYLKKVRKWITAVANGKKEMKYFKHYMMIRPQHEFIEGANDKVEVIKYEGYRKVEKLLKGYGIDSIKKRNVPTNKDFYYDNRSYLKPFCEEFYKKDYERFRYPTY